MVSISCTISLVMILSEAPVLVGLTPQEADRLPGPAIFELTLSPGNRLDVKATVGETSGEQQEDNVPHSKPQENPAHGLMKSNSRQYMKYARLHFLDVIGHIPMYYVFLPDIPKTTGIAN